MRFPLLASAFVFLLAGSCFAQTFDNVAPTSAGGVIKATTKLRPDGSSSTTIVDPDQRTAEETVRDASGKVQKKTTFLLDERNVAIGAVYYDAKGNIRYKESYQRDGADHVTETDFASPDGRSLGRRVFHYQGDKVVSFEDFDAAGNRIASTQPQSQGPSIRHRR